MVKSQVPANKGKKAASTKKNNTASNRGKSGGRVAAKPDSNEEEDEDIEEERALSSHRRSRKHQQQEEEEEEESDDESNAPEEIQTSAEEVARLRAAFEQHYGTAGEAPQKSAKKLKGPAARRMKMKAAAAAGFAIKEQDVLDPDVLAALDGKQLSRGIEITGPEEEEEEEGGRDISRAKQQEKGNGLTIDKNARGSVRLVEGNMEVHILSSKQDKLALFIPTGAATSAAADPLASLLEKRNRVKLANLVAQKGKGASRTFVKADNDDSKSVPAVNYGGKGSNPRKKGKGKLLRKFHASVKAKA